MNPTSGIRSVGLENGRFPANAFYILKQGEPQEHMKREEIIHVLTKISKKITDLS